MTAVPCGEHGKHQRQRLCQARQEPRARCLPSKASPKWGYFCSRARTAAGITLSPLAPPQAPRPLGLSARAPSLTRDGAGRHPPLSALSQHGRCPLCSARCPHQTWRLPFTSHCARPLRAPRLLRRLQRARRKDGGSDCGRLNSREAAKAAHKGGGRRGSRAADPWIRCRGRTRRCRCRSRAGTGKLQGGDARGSRGACGGAGPAGRGRAQGDEPAVVVPSALSSFFPSVLRLPDISRGDTQPGPPGRQGKAGSRPEPAHPCPARCFALVPKPAEKNPNWRQKGKKKKTLLSDALFYVM